MTYRITTVVLVASMTAILIIPTQAMKFRKELMEFHKGGSDYHVYATGDIKPDDDKVFDQLTRDDNSDIIYFNSQGGNLVAGLQIGRLIHEREFSTAVNAGSVCYSACALAWLAGHIMLMNGDASIGTHAAYVEKKGGVKLASGAGNAVAGALFQL